jgi:nicotinic acid phosphoribosyltransferase
LVPVISTLLDTDLYKFTIWQAMLHHFLGNDAVAASAGISMARCA